jgi:hypothetical protein
MDVNTGFILGFTTPMVNTVNATPMASKSFYFLYSDLRYELRHVGVGCCIIKLHMGDAGVRDLSEKIPTGSKARKLY